MKEKWIMKIRESYEKLVNKYKYLDEVPEADILENMIQFQYDANRLFVIKIEELEKEKVSTTDLIESLTKVRLI
jgi:hypothetical protein